MSSQTPPSIPVSHAGTRRQEWAQPHARRPMPEREQPKPEAAAPAPQPAPERPRTKVITVKSEPIVKTRTVYRDRPVTGTPTQAEIDRVLDHVFGGDGLVL